jgi:hypothetical protein
LLSLQNRYLERVPLEKGLTQIVPSEKRWRGHVPAHPQSRDGDGLLALRFPDRSAPTS